MNKILYLIISLFLITACNKTEPDVFYASSATDAVDFTAANFDAFGRLRVGNPQALIDAQLTYDRQPLLLDTIIYADGTVEHDSTNRAINLILPAADSGSVAGIQSFQFLRYQPGKSQLIFLTFNANAKGRGGSTKTIGYSDGDVGIELQLVDEKPRFVIKSNTDQGTQIVERADWNLLPNFNVDFSKTQILVIDFQALYVGAVRVGFNIDEKLYYVHQFNNSNRSDFPYIETANLPIRATIEASGTVTDTLTFICASVMSEGGQESNYSYSFATEGTVTAGNGTDTHVLSIEPRLLFNTYTNRTFIKLKGIELLNTGNVDVIYKIVVGQDITSGTNAFVDTTYSAVEKITGGTLGSNTPIVIDQGYIPDGAGNTSANQAIFSDSKLPITLRYDGTKRDLGRVSVLVQGIGGTSPVRCILKWEEIR